MRTARIDFALLTSLLLSFALGACSGNSDPTLTRDAARDADARTTDVGMVSLPDDGAPADVAITPGDSGEPIDSGSVDAGTPDAGGCGDPGPAPTDPLIVQTRSGQLRGIRDGNTVAFLGIPYAAPPEGALRFRAPEPPACWTGVRDATRYGNVCAQALPSGSRVGNEDCLFVNVWTPRAGETATPRPVLFFIHGGAYIFGSGNQDLLLDGTGNLYRGQRLADEQNAVIVSVNYRLAGLGFLAHPALSAEDAHGSSGNYGMLDQIAALQWVRNNIANFGGDPNRVTIFGESAGGLSVCLLLATPLARGLFNSAIIESGGCNVASQASRFTQGTAVARNVGCATAPDVAACLRRQPAAAFVVQLARDSVSLLLNGDARGLWELPNGPNIDGYVFTEKPMATLRAGRHARVPVIVGSNAQEFELFTPPLATCFDYYALVRGLFRDLADDVLSHYRCLDYLSPRIAAVTMGTDFMFTCPARRMLRAARAGGTAELFRYWFTQTYTSLALGPLRSFHTAELAFVFHTFDVLGYDPTLSDTALSQAMGSYWARFAAGGDPNGGAAFAWPRYDVTADVAIRFDNRISTASQISNTHCNYWDSISLDE